MLPLLHDVCNAVKPLTSEYLTTLFSSCNLQHSFRRRPHEEAEHMTSRRAEHRDLGMDRRIERRDFLNGMALGAVGAYAATHGSSVLAQQPSPTMAPEEYPPARLGLRGQHPSAVEAFARLKSGGFEKFPGVD